MATRERKVRIMFAIVAAFLFIGGACFSLIVVGKMMLIYRGDIMAVISGRPMPGHARAQPARGIGYAPRKLAGMPQPMLPVRQPRMVTSSAALRAIA